MTILNATLTNTAFVLSQDEAHTTLEGVFVTHAPKIITNPARRMIAGAAGTVVFTAALAEFLHHLPNLEPEQISTGLMTLPGAHPDQIAVVGWWNEDEGRPVAYGFKAEDDFAPVAMMAGGGHVISPAEAWIEDREAMLGVSVGATLGKNIEAFHASLAQAQKEAAKRGLIAKPGWRPHSIGGRLHIARLDHQGVAIKMLPLFGQDGFNTAGDVLAARWALHPAAA